MQLVKNMTSRLCYGITNPQNNKKHDIFKYAISKKTCHSNYFYDIINPQNNKKHVIFKYVINKKYVITFYIIH